MAAVLAMRKQERRWKENVDLRYVRTIEQPFRQTRKGEENKRKDKVVIGAGNSPDPLNEERQVWHLKKETVF
jgi:hypothetical protein